MTVVKAHWKAHMEDHDEDVGAVQLHRQALKEELEGVAIYYY